MDQSAGIRDTDLFMGLTRNGRLVVELTQSVGLPYTDQVAMGRGPEYAMPRSRGVVREWRPEGSNEESRFVSGDPQSEQSEDVDRVARPSIGIFGVSRATTRVDPHVVLLVAQQRIPTAIMHHQHSQKFSPSEHGRGYQTKDMPIISYRSSQTYDGCFTLTDTSTDPVVIPCKETVQRQLKEAASKLESSMHKLFLRQEESFRFFVLTKESASLDFSVDGNPIRFCVEEKHLVVAHPLKGVSDEAWQSSITYIREDCVEMGFDFKTIDQFPDL